MEEEQAMLPDDDPCRLYNIDTKLFKDGAWALLFVKGQMKVIGMKRSIKEKSIIG